MKRIPLLIAFGFIVALWSCDDKTKPLTTEMYIFIDVTDTLNRDIDLLQAGVPQILKKFKLSTTDGGLSGGTIKYFLLNETSASPYKTIGIESGIGGVFDERANKYVRNEEVKKFAGEMNSIIKSAFEKGNWDKPSSKIYQQLCRELNTLAQFSKADQKIVLIYSDMLENSELFSFYRGKDVETEQDYTQVMRWIESKENLKKAYNNILSRDCKLSDDDYDLSDIEIYIISNRNVVVDEKINMAEKFWTELFKLNNVKMVRHDAELRFY